jgi:tRNA (guanine-N7-)-methyltransferase
MTPGQTRALQELWPRYGIDMDADDLDLNAIFGRAADKVLEIGFGNGASLVQMALENPQLDFVGIEVHQPGVGHCLIAADSAGLENLRVIIQDAIDVLRQQVRDSSLARVNLLFPDPWPKKRHHKRRIVQTGFLELLAAKLDAGGAVHVATDWENYAEHIDEVIASSPHFALAERREHAGDQPLARPRTKFEARGLRKGHRIWDWRLTLI